MIKLSARERRTLDAMIDTVAFPVVGANVTDFAEVEVERFPMKDHKDTFFVAPSSSIDRSDILGTLLSSRNTEPPDHRHEGVVVSFLSETRFEFEGRSCELALAIADKRARAREGVPERRIIATGQLRHDRSGRIDPIQHFSAKCEGVLNEAARSGGQQIWFCFSKDNWSALEPELAERLTHQERRGRLILRPASHISELDDFWEPLPMRVTRHMRLLVALSSIGLAAVIAASAVGGYAIWRQGPVWACANSLSATEARGDGDWSRAAARCQTAVALRPQSGRAHNLLAIVFAEDNATGLAEHHWERSAKLGHPDGMMSYGWLLWVNARSNDEQAEGLDWLRLAAELGETAAMEQLAIALREDNTGFTDPEEAEEWWDRALRSQ